MFCRESLDFADYGVGWEAAGFASNEGDYAEGAAVVTAVLDFKDGAGVVGFAALDGGGEEFGVVEDVAGEDLGGGRLLVKIRSLAKSGHGMPCPYEGMEWSVWRIRRKKQILLAKNARRWGGPRFARNESLLFRCANEVGGRGKPRPYKGQRRGEGGDLGFVGIADDPGDAWEGGKFFGGALGVAARDDKASLRILGVEFADGVAGLGIGGGGYGAGVEDDDGGGGGIGGGGAAAIEELTFEGGAIGLRGAAAELLDVEGGHDLRNDAKNSGKNILHGVHGLHRGHREEDKKLCWLSLKWRGDVF